MLDWDTYAGNDPLPQDPTWAPQGEVDWLPQPPVKGGFDEFGPMFGSEGGGDGVGDDDGATDLGEVVVTGERPEEPWWDIDNLPGGGGGPTGGTGTGGGGGSGAEVDDPEDDEDCGDPADGPTPDGVDLNDIRDEARRVAAAIAGLNDDWEWGAIIYVLDGQIYSTAPVTQQEPDSIGFNYSNPGYIPTGAHIVA